MHEVGLFLGGSNLIGDIGSRKFINTKAPAFGIIYKYNITTRYSFRGSFSYSNIVNKNFYTNDLNRFRTFLSVSNQITEFSAGVEFNFFDFNQHDQEIYICLHDKKNNNVLQFSSDTDKFSLEHVK